MAHSICAIEAQIGRVTELVACSDASEATTHMATISMLRGYLACRKNEEQRRDLARVEAVAAKIQSLRRNKTPQQLAKEHEQKKQASGAKARKRQDRKNIKKKEAYAGMDTVEKEKKRAAERKRSKDRRDRLKANALAVVDSKRK